MSSLLSIRKIQLCVERVHPGDASPLGLRCWRGSVAAVVANPYAGTFQEDLGPWAESLAPLAVDLAEELRKDVTARGETVEGSEGLR